MLRLKNQRLKFGVGGLIFFILTGFGLSARPVGYAWLTIPVGPREAGMAGCGTASAIGPQALTYNPAATATLSPFSVQLSYTKWLLDTHHQSLFLARNFRELTIGAGIATFSNGRFEYRDERALEEPLATFFPIDLTGYLNLSRTLGPKAEIGVTGRYFYSKILASQASGIGADIGVRFRPIANLTIGAAVVDFGKTLYYEYETFWLPTRGRLGLFYRLPFANNQLNLALDGSYFFYSKRFAGQLGTELVLSEIASLRFGYDLLNPANHLNFGLGVNRGLFRIDYAFTPLAFDLGIAHRFALSFGY